MITSETFHKNGIKPGEEVTPLDILPDNSALTTREIAVALTKRLPDGTITYSCAKQKMKRLEAKGLVQRSVVRGLIHWLKVLKE